MYLLFCMGLLVVVLHDHCCECVFSSNKEYVKVQPHHQPDSAVPIVSNVERSSGLASITVTYPQNTLPRNPNINGIPEFIGYGPDHVPHPYPCVVLYRDTDTIVNCTGKSLKELRATWFPENTTMLLLDNNQITDVDNSSLQSLTQLRYLSLSYNKIKGIQENAFVGLKNLETLNLESNKLSENAYPPGIFDPLLRLNNLFLRWNKQTNNLPGQLFRKLTNLVWLTTDAGGETFSLDNVLTNVTRLTVSGDVKVIDHTSFTSFPHTRELIINDIESLENFTDTALQSLQSLDVLRLEGLSIGFGASLKILKPFTGKNMTSIMFARVRFKGKSVYYNYYNNEGILNEEKTQYLKKICVKHLSLINNRIYVIKINAIGGEVLNKCLRSIDLSYNEFTRNGVALFSLINLKHIELIMFENDVTHCYTKHSFIFDREEKYTAFSGRIKTPNYDNSELSLKRETVYSKRDIEETLINVPRKHMHQKLENNLIYKTDGVKVSDTELKQEETEKCPISTLSAEMKGHEVFRVRISKSLEYFKASGISHSKGPSKGIWIISGGSKFRYLDLSDNGYSMFTGNILDLNMLETLLLSGNDGSVFSETFFDRMCHLIQLDLSNCNLGVHFMSNQSARIFQNLLDLKIVDLSSNLLNALNPGTFASNRLIEKIDLSKSRFRNIPFRLENTPNLNFLNLQENAITTLKLHERDEIDSLATQPPGFRLLISGNILSCGCNNFSFLIWLQTTTVSLDDGRNFTCMNDEGQLSYLTGATDLQAVWRKCWGRTFLSMSLILLCGMLTGFLLVFSVWKNKTFIISKILLILTGYKLKKPHDYPIGVYIGYAENDFIFPCFVLSTIIDELHLTTYKYNRDNIPNRDRASSIVDAINASWRIILVVTDNFLCNDDWAMFTTRTAIYGRSPANPARVVVLVLENLRHRIPQEVLCSVPEDNIFELASWENSDYLKECLKTRLLEF